MANSLPPLDLSRNSENQQGSWRDGSAHFRSFALALCFVLMAAALGVTWLKSRIQTELCDRIETEINVRLQNSNFHCSVGEARWNEGKGLRLADVRFLDRRTGTTIATTEHVFVASKFKLPDLLSGKPKVDSISIDQANLICTFDDQDQCDLASLMKNLRGQDAKPCNWPIHARNFRVSIDASNVGLEQPLELSGLNFDIHHDPLTPHNYEIRGDLSADISRRLDFGITIDQSSNLWKANVSGKRVELNDRLFQRVAKLTGSNRILNSIRGNISLVAVATGRIKGDRTPVFEVAGRATELQCLDKSLPHPVHDGACQFRIDNKKDGRVRLSVEKASCQLGYGRANARFTLQDPLDNPTWRLVGNVTQFQLTERLVPWLTPRLQKSWHNYQPDGFVDSNFDLFFDGKNLHRTVNTNVKACSFSWYLFPFRIANCNGTLECINERLKIDLNAVEAQQLVKITGDLESKSELEWSGWLEARCDGNIPINEKMLQSFDHTKPELAKSLRKFNATGHVNGWGRIDRLDFNSKINRHFKINLKQATVRHRNFDYPIHNVNGLIVVKNDKTTFESLLGQNNHGQIECVGLWTLDHGLQLRFLAKNVLLNDELRSALPVNLQKTWRGLRPNGTLDLVDIDLHSIPGSVKPILDVKVEMAADRDVPSTVTLNPVWFPYQMRQVTGNFRFENQRIEIRDFSATHGQTSMSANGRGSFDDSTWRIRFSDMFASNIDLNESLRMALPTAIDSAIERMKFDGQISMRGALEVTGAFGVEEAFTGSTPMGQSAYVSTAAGRPATANLGWDLQFGLAKSKATIGIPITDANGFVRLRGRYNNGDVDCSGSVNIDSMMYQDIQITSMTAPISIDNHLVRFGALAKPEAGEHSRPSATAKLFGGYIECDGQMELAGDNNFFLQGVMTDGKLNDFATETTMRQNDLSGQAYAGIQIRGDATGTHSAKGSGYITLRNARIYEVPVVLALLKVLRIKEPDRTAFDQGQMEFTINGENIDFRKIELNGDTLSLIGQGSVNLNSEVDLDFYTMMGRNRWFIPVLTRLYQAGSQQVWWVEVDGTLKEPRTNHQVLPGLNDSLKQLFPEFGSEDQ